MATPELAARLGLDERTSPHELIDRELLHLDETDRPWMSWSTWFSHQGVGLPTLASRVSYNNYALVVQEALAGRGIALAWRYLIDDLLDQGLLAPVGPAVRHPKSGYYLIWPMGRRTEAVHRLADWLEALIGR